MNTNVLKNFNAFYAAYWRNPEATKLALINEATKLFLDLVKNSELTAEDLTDPDHMEYYDELGWPYFAEIGRAHV